MNVKYRAVLADQEISANLGLAEGLPIIMAQSTLFSLDNELVACGFSYLNPNIFELEIMRVVNPKRRS
jgi:DNA-binding GntR family transcriptional regulator